MPNEFGDFLTFFIFLFYGLVFFTTGVAITSKVTRGSKLTIARYLPLFAVFAFVHAIHEWLVLFLFLEWPALPPDLLPLISRSRLVPVTVSYIFLLLFGFLVLQAVYPQKRRFLRLAVLSLPAILVPWVLYLWFSDAPEFFRLAALRIRNLLGFPGALASGLGLIGFAGTLRGTSGKVARNFTGAGIALIVYGLFAGLVPTGTVLPLGVRVEIIRGMTGIFILHFLMNAMHIFDLEREAMIEERLQRFAQSEKLAALGKLAAGIAHEINNPLANASLNVELLRKELGASVPQTNTGRFAAIERNIGRASRIARELLYFSRRGEEEFIDTDLNDLVRGTLTLIGAREKEFRIQMELAELPPIRAVPWKLEEVFLNILSNAMEASPPGATILLRTYLREHEVVAEVVDEGMGIAPESLRRIFDPFFTTKEVGQGTGLGLAVSYGIMENHGGRIEVDSNKGKGSVFSMVFPLKEACHGEGQDSDRR